MRFFSLVRFRREREKPSGESPSAARPAWRSFSVVPRKGLRHSSHAWYRFNDCPHWKALAVRVPGRIREGWIHRSGVRPRRHFDAHIRQREQPRILATERECGFGDFDSSPERADTQRVDCYHGSIFNSRAAEAVGKPQRLADRRHSSLGADPDRDRARREPSRLKAGGYLVHKSEQLADRSYSIELEAGPLPTGVARAVRPSLVLDRVRFRMVSDSKAEWIIGQRDELWIVRTSSGTSTSLPATVRYRLPMGWEIDRVQVGSRDAIWSISNLRTRHLDVERGNAAKAEEMSIGSSPFRH